MNNFKMNNIIIDSENKFSIKESSNYKLDCSNVKTVNIQIQEDKEVMFLELKDENYNNKEYNFYVENNSTLYINKFYELEDINEKINIFLNGENSSVILNLSCISKGINNYVVNVYHNNINTSSKTNIHGVTSKSNKILIENNGYIKKGNKGSILIQDNKIINLDDNNSIIKPNLFIDEYDVEASHGAYIGKFDEEELFYLKTRGINDKECYRLLIQGLLLDEFNINEEEKENIKKIINKYWR